MKRNLTLKNYKKSEKEEVVAPSPSNETLDFLKSFARAYYADELLPAPLSGICVN